MHRSLRLISAIVLIAGVGSCSDSPPDESRPTPATSATASSPSRAAGTEITTDSSEFGPVLFDSRKQAIYIWEVETSATPQCYDSCADAWPPVLTDGPPAASGDVKADLLGTATRKDGTKQVTYNGHPLYYYAHENPGEVKCHNVATHGGLWWVVTPAGDRAP